MLINYNTNSLAVTQYNIYDVTKFYAYNYQSTFIKCTKKELKKSERVEKHHS